MANSLNASLSPALMNEAQLIAQEEGLSVEQIINDALEQGLAELRSMHFFRSRRGKGNVVEALKILRRAGNDRPPQPGDEIS
jgi:hypothetical protein